MDNTHLKHCRFENKLIIVGFGSIGQAVIPLILRHMDISPSQIIIVSHDERNQSIATEYGIEFRLHHITFDNYHTILESVIGENDFLLNLAVHVSSKDLIQFCRGKRALYLDTSIEAWSHETLNGFSQETNYKLRENVLALNKKGPTAVLAHGANPGLISHFVKQALYNLAHDLKFNVSGLSQRKEWAMLAHTLGIRTIQIAEYDSQVSELSKKRDEFVNTWSVDGLVIESLQPAEIGWGTHEQHWPDSGRSHQFGSQCAIYLEKHAASVKVRTWTPEAGAFQGYLITHPETISLADYLSLQEYNQVYYRPTVHYAYSPCPDAILSLHELSERNWLQQSTQRLIVDTIISGTDELGVLLLGHPKGAYWFGSQLSIEATWNLAPHNNATTLQVAAGVLAGMVWAIKNPEAGIVEPELMDHEMVLEIARPYLGTLKGYYTDWTPLKDRADFVYNTIDEKDPWQFKNILVS